MSRTSAVIDHGQILARLAREPLAREPGQPTWRRYTARCTWPGGDVEEIDLDAVDERAARECAERELALHYQAGGRIFEIEERYGLYL